MKSPNVISRTIFRINPLRVVTQTGCIKPRFNPVKPQNFSDHAYLPSTY